MDLSLFVTRADFNKKWAVPQYIESKGSLFRFPSLNNVN